MLYEFIVRNETQQKLKDRELAFHQEGDLAMEKEYAQIYGIVMELFDKMVEILGEEKVSGSRVFSDIGDWPWGSQGGADPSQ